MLKLFTKTIINQKMVLENEKPFSVEKGFLRGMFFSFHIMGGDIV
jgi:hypothetical protein